METDPFATPDNDDPFMNDPVADPDDATPPQADPTATEPVAPPSLPAAQETPSAPQETTDGVPAAQPAPEPAPSASEPEAPAAESDGKKPKKPPVFRQYVLLLQTGPEQFTKVDLRGHDNTVDDEDGQTFLSARNNDHAYKLAYHLVGRPEAGATVLPLPKASWRPRHVAPAPPTPDRERLVIS